MTNARVAAICVFAAGVVLFACDPASATIYPACPFHWLTGLYCPVCGSIRGMHALLHGHALEAMRCNALTIGTLAYAAIAAVRRRTSGLLSPGLPRVRPFAWLSAAVAFTVVRNLPGVVGSMLRP